MRSEAYYCSNIRIAASASLRDMTKNFDGEMMYSTPFPPMPPLTVPLPLVGVEEMEYVALTAWPKVGPLGAPMSSVPLRFPVGKPPSAVNSPEKIFTATTAGVVADPA